MNNLKPLRFDQLRDLIDHGKQIAGIENHRINAHFPGFLRKLALPEAYQLSGNAPVQILQQAQHMGFGAAGVAAADQMNDFHEKISKSGI